MVAWREIPGNPDVFGRLEELVKAGDAVGFVGAGASAGLYPLWPQLIAQLADAAIARSADPRSKQLWCGTMDPLDAALQIRRRLGMGAFADLMDEIFGPAKGPDGKAYTPVHGTLARLGFRAFVTTNYDPALTFACKEARPRILIRDFNWRHRRVSLWLKDRAGAASELPILHAHGKYDDGENIVLDAESYRRAYREGPYRKTFDYLWTREQLVIVGFGFQDPWLRIFTDVALSQAGARETSDRSHVAIMGLPEKEIPLTKLHREAIEETYHLRALFYPVGKGNDHSALGLLLEELLQKTSAATPPGGAVTGSTVAAAPPPPDPLAIWFDQVAEECSRTEDAFDRPEGLDLLATAWVQVKVRVDANEIWRGEEGRELKHEFLGQEQTLDEVLELPVGDSSWNQGRWLLEGSPGSGKTTLLRRLAARLAEKASPEKVPVFASLPRLVDSGQGLLEHVTDGLARGGAGGVREALAAAGREGRLLLLLDGYDEVPQEKRAGIRRTLDHLGRDEALSSCRLVVSSRPIGLGDALDHLPRLELQPLSEEKQREFLETWLRHAGKENWKEEAKAALAHFKQSLGLDRFAGVPLYLTLIAVLWLKGPKPSVNVSSLYDNIFDLLLDGGHRRHPRPMPSQSDVREALRYLAYGMTEADLWAEPRTKLEQRLRRSDDLCRRLATVPAWREDLHAFLWDIHERTQILGPHDGDPDQRRDQRRLRRRGDWCFWHRAFREALTAEQLYQQHQQEGPAALVEWARQLEEGGEGRWAEPLALLAGRLPEADALVLQLGEASPSLARRASAVAQGLKPATIKATLRLTDDLEARAEVFAAIPDQLNQRKPCLDLVEQLLDAQPGGFDLFWLWWIVEQVERRWGSTARSRKQFKTFFRHHLPPADLSLFYTFHPPTGDPEPLWRKIPAGKAQVGSPESEEGRDDDEGPVHQVEILQPYWLAATPVTNAQYRAFDSGKAFREWEGVSKSALETHPRVNVSWYEAVSFCRWLATLPGFEGTEPRLPTEEEWEVACRAGTAGRFWKGEKDQDLAAIGWFQQNSEGRTHRVARKPANEYGLYDAHGNVEEWASTPWDSKGYENRKVEEPYPIGPQAPPVDLAAPPRVKRVLRGGSCRSAAQWCRSAYRFAWVPESELMNQGFRVLLSSAPSRP